jgi:dihydrofolate synthase/folylpolyglutamate synthase
VRPSANSGSKIQPTRLAALLERLSVLHPRAIDLSLARVERLLGALGDPHKRLPPTIHVAGTDGKGSTLAFCRAMLEASGRTVHCYTSPHLVRFNERIRVRGRELADRPLADLLERVESANGGEPVTFFEIITAAAFLAFSESAADFLLLETGLGGRLDATNVVARPAVTCITPVDYDHQRYLGCTLGAIAGEKAGILKPHVPAVIAAQRPAALAVILARAAALSVPLHRENAEWRVFARGKGFRFESAAGLLDLPAPSLPGEHQIHNAGTAIACVLQIPGFRPEAQALRRGIVSAEWPARLQRIRHGPLAALLRKGWELWIDGAHNPHGARALASWLATRKAPVHLIAAMIEGKDARGFFAALRAVIKTVTAVPVPAGHAGVPPEHLARLAGHAGHCVHTAPSAAEAIRAIQTRQRAPAMIVVAGSLYLAGAVLAENQ